MTLEEMQIQDMQKQIDRLQERVNDLEGLKMQIASLERELDNLKCRFSTL